MGKRGREAGFKGIDFTSSFSTTAKRRAVQVIEPTPRVDLTPEQIRARQAMVTDKAMGLQTIYNTFKAELKGKCSKDDLTQLKALLGRGWLVCLSRQAFAQFQQSVLKVVENCARQVQFNFSAFECAFYLHAADAWYRGDTFDIITTDTRNFLLVKMKVALEQTQHTAQPERTTPPSPASVADGNWYSGPTGAVHPRRSARLRAKVNRLLVQETSNQQPDSVGTEGLKPASQ